MRRGHLGLFAVAGTTVLALLVSGESARSQRPPAEPATLGARLAVRTGLDEKDVEKVLRELGPQVARDIAAGRQVELPRLGVVRVVRIPEHRDLVEGRPGTVPAVNYVEFVPDGSLVAASNQPGAVPAVVVPPFEYNPLPGRVPSTRVPSSRLP